MKQVLAYSLLALAIFLASCKGETREIPRESPQLGKLSDARFMDTYPLASGGAYAVTDSTMWWYLVGSSAIPVVLQDDTTATFQYYGDLMPLACGGAYVNTWIHGLWYLSGNKAVLIEEVETVEDLDSIHIVPGGAIWATLWGRHLREREVLEQKLHEYEEAYGERIKDSN